MRRAPTCLALLALAGAAQAEAVGGTAWDVRVQPGAFDSPPCVARIAGPDISTSVLQNRDGLAVLVLARPDWRFRAQQTALTVSIDGDAPVNLQGDMINNLVLPNTLGSHLVERLKRARTLDWTMPHGRFRGDIAGFGEAWAALQACNAKASAPTAGPKA